MGWINCDRFYNDKSPKIDCNILVQQDINNTIFYLVFEDIKSIMQPSITSDNNVTFLNLPKNKQVKLIGISVINGQVHAFTKQGKIKDFKQFTPNFEPIRKAAIADMLAQQ